MTAGLVLGGLMTTRDTPMSSSALRLSGARDAAMQVNSMRSGSRPAFCASVRTRPNSSFNFSGLATVGKYTSP